MRTPWSVPLFLVASLAAVAVVYRDPGTGMPEAGGPDVRVVGLQRQSSPAPVPVFGDGNVDPLRLALEVRLPRARILGLEPATTRVLRLEDDHGLNLLDPAGTALEPGVHTAADGRYLRLYLRTPTAPSASAGGVLVEGVLALRVAERSRVHVAPQEKPLNPGTRFHLGEHELEVVETGTLSWNGHATLTLASRRPLDAIGAYRLLTGTGRRVDLEPRALYATGDTWRQTLEGEEALDSASLAIEVWEDVRTIELPFRVTAAL